MSDSHEQKFINQTMDRLIDESLSIFELAMKAYKQGRNDEARSRCAELDRVMRVLEHAKEI